MESTCKELLDVCLSGGEWTPQLLERALEVDEGRAFLSVVVERLGDLFEPRLCIVYDRLFKDVVKMIAPGLAKRIRGPARLNNFRERPERVYVLSRITLGSIGDHVRSDAQEPGAEWRARPFESIDVRQGLAKHFAGHIFARRAIAHSPRNIGIDQFEVSFVHVSKMRAILLRRLDQTPLITFVPLRVTRFLCRFAARHWLSNLYKLRPNQKVMRLAIFSGLGGQLMLLP